MTDTATLDVAALRGHVDELHRLFDFHTETLNGAAVQFRDALHKHMEDGTADTEKAKQTALLSLMVSAELLAMKAFRDVANKLRDGIPTSP